MVCKTLKASRPKLKKEKKYCFSMLAWGSASGFEPPYFLNSVRLLTVYHADLQCLRKSTDRTFFDVNDVLDRQRYFNAVTVIVRAEDNLLKGFNPFLCTGSTVRLQMKDTLVGDNGDIFTFL